MAPLTVKTLCQDDFPNPEDQIPMVQDHVDWEIPQSINMSNYFKQVLEASRKYDVVIAEGLFAFCDKRIVRHYDKKIFMTISKETFWDRKSKDFRWGKEPEWYMDHIWESHFKCGSLQSLDKDTVILSGEDPVDLQQLIPELEFEKYLTPSLPEALQLNN